MEGETDARCTAHLFPTNVQLYWHLPNQKLGLGHFEVKCAELQARSILLLRDVPGTSIQSLSTEINATFQAPTCQS
jgi:hypothetical protein